MKVKGNNDQCNEHDYLMFDKLNDMFDEMSEKVK